MTRTKVAAKPKRSRARPLHQPVCRIPDEVRHVARIARSGGGRELPSMSFRGEWLREAGFAPGARILLRVLVRGQLVVDRID
jgi:type I toxin-antitoxin system toxin SymE